MRQLYPSYSPDVDLLDAYAFPPDAGTRPWLRANMVSSVDGAATVDGRSAALGGDADALVFATLRGLCDAVMVGAGTARVEGYRALRAKPAYGERRASLGQRPAPVLVVVSRRLDLEPASELFHGGPERTVVVTCESSDRRRRTLLGQVADVVVAGEDRVDVSVAAEMLAARGLRRLLCEGGPHLLADLAASGRLDELCVTFAPELVGSAAMRITAGAVSGVPLLLDHLLEQDSTLLARYVRRSRAPLAGRPAGRA